MEWAEAGGVRWLRAALPGATACFSARTGGVSEGPYTSLNLGVLTGDEEVAVRENRARLADAVAIALPRFLIGRQVHGVELQVRDRPPDPNPFAEPGAEIDEVDAQVTTTAGLAPLVFVADCLPIALTGPAGVAMLHCGWRGLAGGIVERGVAATEAQAAAIGPGIGPCCYEVGDEVRARFDHLGEDITSGHTLDLAAVARRQLADAGVREVDATDLCTSCEPDLFFSHRRDGGETGRQAGLVWSGGAR